MTEVQPSFFSVCRQHLHYFPHSPPPKKKTQHKHKILSKKAIFDNFFNLDLDIYSTDIIEAYFIILKLFFI